MEKYSKVISEESREYTQAEVEQGMLEWKLQQVHKFWTEAGWEKIDAGINGCRAWWKYGKPIAQ